MQCIFNSYSKPEGAVALKLVIEVSYDGIQQRFERLVERLVMHNIKTNIPNTLDPLQFAYRPNRSTDDAISSTLHLALTHLENKDSYVRMLFIDFSSAFNTIIPQQLINKLSLLGLNNSLCNWILDTSTPRLWRESAALNSWGCTSQRTSPGLPTPSLSPRRHNSAYTFSAG